MTIDFGHLLRQDQGQSARSIMVVDPNGFDAWLAVRPLRERTAVLAQGLKPTIFASAILPGDAADAWSVVTVVADAGALTPWCLARLAESLPEGDYRIDGDGGCAALGWLLGQHGFDRYKSSETAKGPRVLLVADLTAADAIVREAEAVALVRDLVNTPAIDMGPAQLEAVAARIAGRHDAQLTVTQGRHLEYGYPLIHAVGMAAHADFSPRLIEIEWGDPAHPRIAIIGKGITFDSGGLDIKPASGMRLMKKDMGGAAHALALAELVMASGLPVRLHLLVPAAENAIAGNAFRPGDILRSRNGLTVEVGNTDAEGRLVLADALTKAGENAPVLIVDFATLTGAARVALGPELPALFANNVELAGQLLAAGDAVGDRLWQLPLHDGYDEMLKSDIADLTNAPDSGFAGAVTAALFLRRFVPKDTPWIHLDTFAWTPSAKPGRPKGGEALGLRAVAELLRTRFA